jgi:hypothetical protein
MMDAYVDVLGGDYSLQLRLVEIYRDYLDFTIEQVAFLQRGTWCKFGASKIRRFVIHSMTLLCSKACPLLCLFFAEAHFPKVQDIPNAALRPLL